MNSPDAILMWERERSRLSHDTLKNELIPMISKAHQILEGKVQDDTFEVSLPSQIQHLGGQVCDGMTALLQSVHTSLSPARYLEMAPLSGLDSDSKQWLSVVIQGSWKSSVRLDDRTNDAKSHCDSVFECIRTLDGWASMSLTSRKALLQQLLHEVRNLAGKLAELKTLLPYPI